MPTRSYKYHKFAYAYSVGVLFLTNSFHGKKNVAQLKNSRVFSVFIAKNKVGTSSSPFFRARRRYTEPQSFGFPKLGAKGNVLKEFFQNAWKVLKLHFNMEKEVFLYLSSNHLHPIQTWTLAIDLQTPGTFTCLMLWSCSLNSSEENGKTHQQPPCAYTGYINMTTSKHLNLDIWSNNHSSYSNLASSNRFANTRNNMFFDVKVYRYQTGKTISFWIEMLHQSGDWLWTSLLRCPTCSEKKRSAINPD